MEKFEQRAPVADIAAELRVSKRSVQRWRRAWQAGGAPGLASKGQAPGVGWRDQLAELDRVLDAGPAASGWQDQRWTLARIRDLIAAKLRLQYTDPGNLVPVPPWVELPARRPPRDRAGRRRDRGVEEGDLAPGKSTAAARGAWIVLRTRPASG